MSWIKTLSRTYDNILKQGDKNLLPVAHSTQNSHIEITLNSESEMIHADFVNKDDASTVIPVTESSASRGNGSMPHPLCDKLQYLAGDYKKYGGSKGDIFHKDYMEQLKAWSDSEYTNQKIKIIYNYLSKSRLIYDLIKFNILFINDNNDLYDKFNSQEIKLAVGGQFDAFIRFRIITSDDYIDALWLDPKMYDSYTSYYLSKLKNIKFCYASGEAVACSNNHPSKVLHSADKSKIISSNDTTNFTFKGRFHIPEEAVSIGYEISQKAHNALKWLINKQGQRVGNKTFVLWGTENQNTPKYLDDTVDFCSDMLGINNINIDLTKKNLSEDFNKAILGYKAEIKPNTKLALIGLDPPTTGRLSIIFYREYNGLEGHELIDNIKKWHEETSWSHRYKFKDKKIVPFYGAPSILDIVRIAYGTDQNGIIKADDKITANVVERLLPCVIDGTKIPKDIALRLMQRAKQPQCYDNIYTWYKVLTVSCAVYRKYLKDYVKEEYTMEVRKTDNIAYNCGRLLAIADAIESWSLRDNSSPNSNIRATNAIRYFTKFAVSPASTWGIINDKLIPHKQRLGTRGTKLYKLLGEISNLINPDDFEKATNLDGCMVLGYDTQRQALFTESKEKEIIEEE